MPCHCFTYVLRSLRIHQLWMRITVRVHRLSTEWWMARACIYLLRFFFWLWNQVDVLVRFQLYGFPLHDLHTIQCCSIYSRANVCLFDPKFHATFMLTNSNFFSILFSLIMPCRKTNNPLLRRLVIVSERRLAISKNSFWNSALSLTLQLRTVGHRYNPRSIPRNWPNETHRKRTSAWKGVRLLQQYSFLLIQVCSIIWLIF